MKVTTRVKLDNQAAVQRTLSLAVAVISLTALTSFSAYLINRLCNDTSTWNLISAYLGAGTPVAPHHRIAMFMGADIPALQSQKKGIIDFLESQNISVDVSLFYHQGNQQILSAQMKEAVASQPDVIFTIGTLASQTAHQMLIKRDSKIPLVFSGVMQPIESGLSQTEELTGFNSTGLAENYSSCIPAFLENLQLLVPGIKKVGIVYGAASGGMQKQVKELNTELSKLNIKIKNIEIYSVSEVYEKTRNSVDSSFDALLILRDYITTSALPALKRVCEETGTTLYASDAHSVEQGAAAGYCIDEYEIGLIVAQSIVSILRDKKMASELPMIYLNAAKLCSLRINPFAMYKQGVSKPIEYFLSQPDVVVTHC